MNKQQQTEAAQAAWIYSTVKQFCERHPAFTAGGMRSVIFNADNNGLAKSGAIVRQGRKVLIKEQLYFDWLESGQTKAGA
jgi:phage tail protein X